MSESLEQIAHRPPVDLTDCDLEAIHLSGAIQPHGVLLFLRGEAGQIAAASANTAWCLGLDPRTLLGRSAADIFGPQGWEALRSAARSQEPVLLPPAVLATPGGTFTGTVTAVEDGWMVEFESVKAVGTVEARHPPGLTAIKHRVPRIEDARRSCEKLTAAIAELIGYDRVMAYRFHDDWSGQVYAEAVKPGVESFLGLHFPASDIPKIARELYLKNRTRLIADVGYHAVPVLQEEGAAPLDLTYAQTRSVSPIHLQYLRNMRVAASFSISLVLHDTLWGLIACHNETPLYVPPAARLEAAALARNFSVGLASFIAAQRLASIANADAQLAAIARLYGSAPSPLGGVAAAAPALLRYMRSNGLAVLTPETCQCHGLAPDPATVRDLYTRLAPFLDGAVFCTHRLSQYVPEAEKVMDVASGVYVVQLGRLGREEVVLVFLRPDRPQTILWAGNPEKAVPTDRTLDIHPRRSFQRWQEITRGQSEPWSSQDDVCARRLLLRLRLGRI
jgi:two-component system, chemotaxis family, sensor kinase Cph1